MRERLEKRGVIFKRLIARCLGDLKEMGHDVLVNATSFGSAKLQDVQEKNLVLVKQQNIRVRHSSHNRLYIRRGEMGEYYSTAFAHSDGTVYIGGIKTLGVKNFIASVACREKIMRRAHENQPDVFPSPNLEDNEFICDHVGVYPIITQNGGVRIEKQHVSWAERCLCLWHGSRRTRFQFWSGERSGKLGV
ncbi:hypothetical protein LTR41_010968 [Exophiala xenobiotica]|nr:hypothetical protein LTR41_010968 [Exophiala xenobiotica]KAK5551136.1 hypothetical protein LTR46_010889 [Exophiala xenobiotica]